MKRKSNWFNGSDGAHPGTYIHPGAFSCRAEESVREKQGRTVRNESCTEKPAPMLDSEAAQMTCKQVRARMTMMDEARLKEKLRLIEALFAGAKTAGEKDAADRAKQRILERLSSLGASDPPIAFKFTLRDMWQRKVMVALMRRYGLKPYRYRGQRYTTVMTKAPRRFINETLWPEFQEISETLHTYLAEVTERVVSEVICRDNSEADVVDEPLQLPEEADSAYSE